MAHKLIAVDLGASSIKLARFESTFRKATFIDARVIPCRAEGPAEERIPRQLSVLAQTAPAEYPGDGGQEEHAKDDADSTH